jgi:biopolymer transport protein ExbB
MELAVYILLAVTSVVGLTFVVERGWALRWRKVVPPAIEAAVQSCRSRDDVAILRRVCEAHPSPIGRLLLLSSAHLKWPRADNVDALQTQARREITRLERGLVVLEILVGIAPLLGLVGTIYGMMSLFQDLGVTGVSDATRLAQGIGLILHATLMGLLIAIPALVFWSFYTKRVEVLAVEMERLCEEFVRRQYMDRSRS